MTIPQISGGNDADIGESNNGNAADDHSQALMVVSSVLDYSSLADTSGAKSNHRPNVDSDSRDGGNVIAL